MKTIRNIHLANMTLTVSSEISETGKITLDGNGSITLPEDRAEKLLQVEGFSEVKQAVNPFLQTENPGETDTNAEESSVALKKKPSAKGKNTQPESGHDE